MLQIILKKKNVCLGKEKELNLVIIIFIYIFIYTAYVFIIYIIIFPQFSEAKSHLAVFWFLSVIRRGLNNC